MRPSALVESAIETATLNHGCAYLVPSTAFIENKCFQAEENDGGIKRFSFSNLRFYLDIDLSRFILIFRIYLN